MGLIRCIEASHKLKAKKLVINSLDFDGQQSSIELATLIQYELTNRRNIKSLNFLISMEKKSISIEIIIKYVIRNSRLFWKYELINEIVEIRNKVSINFKFNLISYNNFLTYDHNSENLTGVPLS